MLEKKINKNFLYRFSKICLKFNEVKEMDNDEEFVEVECYEVSSEATSSGEVTPKKVRGAEVYRDFHAFVPTKLKVEERCDKVPRTDDQVLNYDFQTAFFLLFLQQAINWNVFL